MATLHLSANFWTLRDDVIVPDLDLGAFKYHNKDSEALLGPQGALKRSLGESRGQAFTPSNKRPSKLRDNLIELEDILSHHVLVHVDWSAGDQFSSGLLVFSNGFIVHLLGDLHSSSLSEVVIDRTLEGKLLADIVSVATAPQQLFLAHGIPRLTVIQISQPLFSTHRSGTPLLSQCSVTVTDVQLPGPGTRRQERRVSFSPNNASMCVWWERDGGELFAWAPVVKAEDRANVLVYSAPTDSPNSTAELLGCHYTEHNPFSVLFSAKDPSHLRVTELMSTAKGRLSVSYSTFSIQQPFKLIQHRVLRIPALLRCHGHSPDEQILLLGCVDASIIAWDLTRDSITSYKASFIPFHLSWHGSSSFFVAGGERGQLQCWDRALNPLLLRSPSTREAGSPVIHLQQYLRHQPSVVSIKWAVAARQEELPAEAGPRAAPSVFNRHQRQKSMRSKRKKSRSPGPASRKALTEHLSSKAPVQQLLVCFERGPVVCLQFLTSCWPLTSPINSMSLCADYLAWHQLEPAVRHVLSLKWTNVATFQEEDVLLACLLRVVNGLLQDGSPNADDLLQRLITSVLDRVPKGDELVDPVFDAARRACRAMLRKGRLQSASDYAIRLQDPDLLVELVLHARKAGDEALVAQATTILDCVRDDLSTSCTESTASSGSRTSSRSSSYVSGSCCSSSSGSSGSSCSTCDGDEEEEQVVPAQQPLPASVNNNNNIHQQFSNLRLVEDNDDHVHVISFGVV